MWDIPLCVVWGWKTIWTCLLMVMLRDATFTELMVMTEMQKLLSHFKI